MIVREEFEINGKKFIRTFSDDNRYVVRDGVSYEEACDPSEFNRNYIEGEYMSNDKIGQQAIEILDILLGVNNDF